MIDREEVTGILTHHLVQDRASYDFITKLFAITDNHDAARWLNGADIFAA
jgi:hypothetical protein